MTQDAVGGFIGGSYRTLRDAVTDPLLPFSSAPEIGPLLAEQSVSLIFNSYQSATAPPAGRPYAVQNTVQGYPAAANATTAFEALRTAWQGTLFESLTAQADLGAGWEESFCQLGDFVSTNAQGQKVSTQWFVCMARSGPYVVTVSIGAFPGLDVVSVAAAARSYFDAALQELQ